MGREPVGEEDENNYTFFYHLFKYMKGLGDVEENAKAQTARTTIIQHISNDQHIFTRVSFRELFMRKIN